jgi:hypothetical protein
MRGGGFDGATLDSSGLLENRIVGTVPVHI